MSERIDTVIVGGGQGGLATSYFLSQRGHPHVVLEQAAQAGHAWRDGRWDSFTLVTPNWSFRLPGMEYDGPEPDGFMPRDEIVASFERYVARFKLPVRYGQHVCAVDAQPGGGYRVQTTTDTIDAHNVVIATGLFQRPKLPAFAAQLPPEIVQLHTGDYRSPEALPAGAVLVGGSGQSGCQIAEELNQCGRTVYLCTGSAGRAPRRYRGRDLFAWLTDAGFVDRTPDKLPSPKAKFASPPQVSGAHGGHSLNLHQFARDGIGLLGRLIGAEGVVVQIAPDLHENLAKSDKLETDICTLIDGYIARAGLDAPSETLPALRDGYGVEPVTRLDLRDAGVTTIIWALGYAFDFNFVHFPIFDGDGFPIQEQGVTAYPGLYFVGLPWLPGQKSGLLLGVGEQAAHIVATIVRGAPE